MNENEWVDLSECFAHMWHVGEARTAQKKHFASSAYFNPNSHEIGMLAEKTTAILLDAEVNENLVINGVGGCDFFDLVECKGATCLNSPNLILYKEESIKPVYVLITVDVQNKRGRLVGWITGHDFIEKRVEKNFGYGPRWAVKSIHLNKNLAELMTLLGHQTRGWDSVPSPVAFIPHPKI